MPLIDNEQEIKRNSQFLDYETGDGGNSLILKSKLYQITSHFLDNVKRSVICRGEECLYCGANYPKRSEYNYMVYLNGSIGFMDVKSSVFFSMQGIAKAQKKDMRQMSWTVIKKGEGLLTKYTTSKDDNLDPEDYKKATEELDENTNRLVAAMERHEEDLNQNYTNYMRDIREQKTGRKKQEPEVKQEVEEPGDASQEVDPEQIPF